MVCLCLSNPCSITTTHAVDQQPASVTSRLDWASFLTALKRAKRLLQLAHVVVIFQGFGIYTPSACDACKIGGGIPFVQYYFNVRGCSRDENMSDEYMMDMIL